MAEVLNVEARQSRGRLEAKRMRQNGKIPAVLYGHNQGSVSLTLAADELSKAMRHGGRLYELKGMVNETAVIRELQYDTFGVEVLHVDFMRVQANERLTVTVPVETRGQAPGVKEGGVLKVLLHEVELETLATAIPEKLHVNINHLHLDGEVTASEIEDLPAGAKLLTEPSAVIVNCTLAVEAEEEEAEGGAMEPEVIGRKAESEEDEE